MCGGGSSSASGHQSWRILESSDVLFSFRGETEASDGEGMEEESKQDPTSAEYFCLSGDGKAVRIPLHP